MDIINYCFSKLKKCFSISLSMIHFFDMILCISLQKADLYILFTLTHVSTNKFELLKLKMQMSRWDSRLLPEKAEKNDSFKITNLINFFLNSSCIGKICTG